MGNIIWKRDCPIEKQSLKSLCYLIIIRQSGIPDKAFADIPDLLPSWNRLWTNQPAPGSDKLFQTGWFLCLWHITHDTYRLLPYQAAKGSCFTSSEEIHFSTCSTETSAYWAIFSTGIPARYRFKAILFCPSLRPSLNPSLRPSLKMRFPSYYKTRPPITSVTPSLTFSYFFAMFSTTFFDMSRIMLQE